VNDYFYDRCYVKLKQKIYNHFLQAINARQEMLQQVLNDLKESGANETKSTAGDKHETALAMLQIEQANTRGQLQELLLQKAALEKLDPALAAPVIVNGSLIKTSRGYFYMSVAMGKAAVEGIVVIALSPQSPLGQKLLGLKKGAMVRVNDIEYTIESIE